MLGTTARTIPLFSLLFLLFAGFDTPAHATATLNPVHENLLFVAAADATTVRREQQNLAYDLDFTTSNAAINIVGVSLIPNTLGSATFTATAVSPDTVRIELLAGTAAPADYFNAMSGTPVLSWSHDGVPSSTVLNIEMRAVDKVASIVFPGYTSTSAATSDITPITINGVPPFGGGQYAWTPLAPSSPSGLSFTMVNHNGIFGPQNQRWVVASVGTGPEWDIQNTAFKVEFSNNIGNVVHNPVLEFDLRLRSFSGVTICEGQSLYTPEGPISSPAIWPPGYTLSPSVADGSTITMHPDRGSIDTAIPASGWDTDTTMTVDVTDGPFCTTLTVRDIDVRFRALRGDGYTIFRGHQRGQGILNLSLPNDTYVVTQEGGANAFPLISVATGVTPLLSFDLAGALIGLPIVPPASHWNSDDTLRIFIKDGDRPRSRVTRAISFREFPNELSLFEHQTGVEPAVPPTTAGSYDIAAVDPAWLAATIPSPPVLLGSGAPRPVFSAAAELTGYLDGDPSPALHTNALVVTNGQRPWSAGASVDFRLRHFASDFLRIDALNPLILSDVAPTIDTVDPGTSWLWQNVAINGQPGYVWTLPGPSADIEVYGPFGPVVIDFELASPSTSVWHPTIQIGLPGDIVPGPGPLFRRGDCNNDGSTDIGDPVRLLGFLFPPAPPPDALDCDNACDANDDESLDIADAIAMLTFLFPANPPPQPLPVPSTICGVDPTFGTLLCVGYHHCP